MRRNRFRRSGFGTRRQAITRSDIPMPKTKSRRKCAACAQILTMGEPIVRLRLKKAFQLPCSGCGHLPAKLKFFHAACVPGDINKAMGYDPNAHGHGTTPPPSASYGGAVPPPPKPKTPEQYALEALAALEQAVIARAQRQGVTKEMEAAFKQFQGIKARVLRPGTPAEGETATSIALQRIIKMVYA